MPPASASLTFIAAACFATAATSTRILLAVAPRIGLIDHPSAEKLHQRPTPVAGGLAILLALQLLLFLPIGTTRELRLLLEGAVLLGVIGLIDDRRGVPAVLKFLVLIALTTGLWTCGIAATTTRIPLLDLAITVLWVTGVSSAFNAIDNMDGVASGVTAIAAGGFLVIAIQTGQWSLGALSAALLGASLGFLAFNFPPARIFMGDTGSFPLGFLLAGLGLIGEWNQNEIIAAIIPLLLLGLPLFDLAFTVSHRHLSGTTRTVFEALRHCDTDHLAHRLRNLGLSTRETVFIVFLVSASLALSAISLRGARSSVALLHLLQAAVIVAAFFPLLHLGHRTREIQDPSREPTQRMTAWLVALAPIAALGLYSLMSW